MSEQTDASWFSDIFRGIVGGNLNNWVYSFIVFVYQVFFNIASAEVFNGNTIREFYGRVQMILGIVMVFRLMISVIQGIIDPDKFTDQKSGFGNVITRIIISLMLLTALTPINIPKPASQMNSFEKSINNNGMLFGVLYDFQNRILKQNILGKIILNTNNDTEGTENDLENSGNNVATAILKGFMRVNLKEEGLDEKTRSNWYCDTDRAEELLDEYNKDNVSPSTLLSSAILNAECDVDGWTVPIFGNDEDRYIFAFNWILALVVGVVFVIILISFCVELAKRAIKLAILRLIAPIPIISYMAPSKNVEALNAWTKTLTSTYIDLFIQLSIMYFVIFLTNSIIKDGLVLRTSGGLVGVFSIIFIWIGLFLFAKEAPKFIKQAMGMKDEGGKGWFSGIAQAAGLVGTGAGIGAAIGAVAAGGIGSMAANYKGTKAANAINHPGSRLNGLRNVGSALLGGMSGMATGAGAAVGAKDHKARAAMDAMKKRNATIISRGESGSSLTGRALSTASRLFTGESEADRIDREISSMEAQKSSLEAIKSRASSEMPKQDWTYGAFGRKDANGKDILANYKSFMAAKNAAIARKEGTFSFLDSKGNSQSISMEEANMCEGLLLKNNEDDYIQRGISDRFKAADGRIIEGKQDKILVNDINDAEERNVKVSGRDSVTKQIDELSMKIVNQKRENDRNKANDYFSGK